MAVAAAIITVGAAIFGAVQQRKAAKAQRKQARVSNRIQQNKRMRDIRKAIALQRVRRAEIQSAGFQLGVAGGSAVAGSVGSLGSNLGSTIGAAGQQFTGQQAITSISNQISGLQQSAAIAGAVGSIAGGFAGGPGTEGAQNREAFSSFFE